MCDVGCNVWATLGHFGGTTQAADLVSVTPTATVGTYQFKFDRTLSTLPTNSTGGAAGPCEKFVLYFSDRTEARGDSCFIVNANSDTVEVSFNTGADDGDPPYAGGTCCGGTLFDRAVNQDNAGDVVAGAAGHEAVHTQAPQQGSTIGRLAITGFSGNRAGITDGPDLILATFNTAASQITYRFDEAIDFASVVPTAFFVVDQDGIATAGQTATASANANEVIITFADPQDVVEGVGAGVVNANPGSDQQGIVNADAVLDPQGNNNSPDSVGRS